MILRDYFKQESFLTWVCQYVSPQAAPRTKAAEDGAIYIGDGYWRAALVYEDDRLLGVRLINPYHTAAEIATVEQGVALLIGCYQE